jgi:methyl-accepting chemotaxis protein
MKWFNDLKISSKLLVGFMLVAVVAAVSGWLSLSAMGEMKTRSHAMYADRLMSITDLSYANFAFLITRADVRGYIMTKDPAQRREIAADIETQAKAAADRLESFRKKTLSKEETDLLEKHVAARDSYYRARAQVIELAGSGQDAKALEALEAAQPVQEEARKELRALIDLNSHGAEDEEKANEADAESARTKVLAFIAIGVLLAIGLGLMMGRMIGNPLKAMLAAAQKLATGDVNVSVDLHSKDEVGALAHAFRAMTETIKDRAGLGQKIAGGDVTVDVKPKSEQDVLGKSFVQVVETLRKLIAEMEKLTKSAAAGQLATRGNAEQFQGGYKQIVDGVNQTLDAVIGPLNVSAEYVDRISKGDIPPKITDKYNGDFNEIKNNLNNCIDNINALVADTGMLIKAAVEGKLAARADASKHQGDFRKIVEGVNQTLDAVIGPLNVSAEYVDRISKGDLPPKITDTYKGDFNEIKNNLNNCIDRINALASDASMLVTAAVEGKLATRADASKHQGDFRKIVEGVNQTMDAVIGPLNVSAEYVDRISKGDIPPKITDNYKGDFNEIKNNLNNCIDNIRSLVTETGLLIKASEEGKLATRADASKHQGDYRKIVAGVNEMLDAILLPIGEGNRILAQVSTGKIDELIAQTYQGDHEKMKQAVNNVALVMQGLQKELGRLTQASHDGKLSERGKAD